MNNYQTKTNALIFGASRGIGLGFVKALLKKQDVNIYATYRRKNLSTELFSLETTHHQALHCLAVDVTKEDQIVKLSDYIQQAESKLHLVINCVGILHEGTLQPEKSLRHINLENLVYYFQVNSIASVLIAKHFLPLFCHSNKSILAFISAKIGSIHDNHLGGWYGYRASKAALNMFMRTIAIEYSRKCPQTIVVSLHPGTTDTDLSKSFQKNISPHQLFSIEKTLVVLFKLSLDLNKTTRAHD
jgi:NAD(P)-dependent dehydrogenase (short-subunit alcohol dehydrogenase family)